VRFGQSQTQRSQPVFDLFWHIVGVASAGHVTSLPQTQTARQ
jgi:hypothetical protein